MTNEQMLREQYESESAMHEDQDALAASPSADRSGCTLIDNEVLAALYIKISGKPYHASDCATSNAPALTPGPCDCDSPSAGNEIPLPSNADQASGMVLLGMQWLKDNAPERLRTPSAAPVVSDEQTEDAYVIDKLARILAGVAIALKGEELPLHRHGYHDLAELAHVLVLERDLLKAQVASLSAHALATGGERKKKA